MAEISLSLSDLQTIVTRAAMMGRVEMTAQYLPQTKYVSRPNVLEYLKVLGLKGSVLKEWEDRGLLKDIQNGSGGTHKYSRVEIQNVLLVSALGKVKKDINVD